MFSIHSIVTLNSVGQYPFDLYHWVAHKSGYLIIHSYNIMVKEQIHSVHLTATWANQRLSTVIFQALVGVFSL